MRLLVIGSDTSTLTEKLGPSPAALFHDIEPFAARQMIRSQEITPLFA